MTDQVTIRNLVYDDIIPLVRICNQTFLEGARFSEAGAQAVHGIQKMPEWQWGAFSADELKGFLLVEPKEDLGKANIRLIGVDPDFKGKGIGSLLLNASEQKAKEAGVGTLSVGTPFARGFYEKNGFECARIHLKVIRDITCQPITRPSGVKLYRPDLDDAARIGSCFEDETVKYAFYQAFLRHYRASGGLFTAVETEKGGTGIVIAAVPEVNHDFAEAVFFSSINGLDTALLVRAFEYIVSTKGLRYVGFRLEEDEREVFEQMGYSIAEKEFFWTMYTLEKKIT
jgi:GNAT superfamily N-acetyltransferase